MRKHILSVAVFLVMGIYSPYVVEAQGSLTYFSNLADSSTGSEPVGSDSWLAELFITGNNPGGYDFNSVQLAMTDASGTPADFSVMLYSSVSGGATFPGVSLGTLSGSMDPSTAGTYTYTAPVDLTLAPNSLYYIVVTAGTTTADGAYGWSVTSTDSDGYDNWVGTFALLGSSDGVGMNWNQIVAFGQYALDATPAPEPGVLSLLGLGGLFFVWNRWKSKSFL